MVAGLAPRLPGAGQAAGLKPPTTWQELYEAAKKLKKGDVWGAAWEMKGRYAALRFGNALAPGTTWLDKDYRLSALRDPRTIENMKIWRQLRSARVSAMSEDDRRQELRAAENRAERGRGRGDPAGAAAPARLEPPPETRAFWATETT